MTNKLEKSMKKIGDEDLLKLFKEHQVLKYYLTDEGLRFLFNVAFSDKDKPAQYLFYRLRHIDVMKEQVKRVFTKTERFWEAHSHYE